MRADASKLAAHIAVEAHDLDDGWKAAPLQVAVNAIYCLAALAMRLAIAVDVIECQEFEFLLTAANACQVTIALTPNELAPQLLIPKSLTCCVYCCARVAIELVRCPHSSAIHAAARIHVAGFLPTDALGIATAAGAV